MITQILNTTIVILLVALVALPAAMLLVKTSRVRLERRRLERARRNDRA